MAVRQGGIGGIGKQLFRSDQSCLHPYKSILLAERSGRRPRGLSLALQHPGQLPGSRQNARTDGLFKLQSVGVRRTIKSLAVKYEKDGSSEGWETYLVQLK